MHQTTYHVIMKMVFMGLTSMNQNDLSQKNPVIYLLIEPM